MVKRKTIYVTLTALLALASCAQEEPKGGNLTGEGNRIYFRSYLPSITQIRGGVMSEDSFTECRVSCINPNDTTLIDPESGEIAPYFSDIHFEKNEEGHFMAHEKDTCKWPTSNDKLHFFAYYPSAKSMQETIDDEKFNLKNYSTKAEGTPVIDYRMERFRIAPDMADHVDFVAAYSSGTKQDNLDSGIKLNFTHQLARIEFSASNESKIYDIDIAGVRIGNALTEGDFNFSAFLSGNVKTWINTTQTPVEHIFTSEEKIVPLSKDAASIMGKSGPAMVIPMQDKIEAWKGKGDPAANKLYVSILLRVKNPAKGNEVVYPYPNDRDNLPVVYLVVGNDGTVIRRVYKIDDDYYTDNENREELKYSPKATEEIYSFGWATVPVAAKWDAGKIYTYKLNYTEGVGWQDPSYPDPGEPIISDRVLVNVSVTDWVSGEDNDVTVPRK